MKAWAEDNLARVQDALVVAEEARRKAKAEVTRLEVERNSLMLEIGATKDEVSSLHSQMGNDKAVVTPLPLVGVGERTPYKTKTLYLIF